MADGRIRLIYVVYDGVISSAVFDGQVIGLLKQLQLYPDLILDLICFEKPLIYYRQRAKLTAKRSWVTATIKLRPRFWPRLPGRLGLFAAVLLAAPVLFSPGRRQQFDKTIWQGRGTKATSIGCFLKRFWPSLKIVTDLRGAEPEEYLQSLAKTDLGSLRPREKKTLAWIKETAKFALGRSDHIFCVSHQLKFYLQAQYGLPENKIQVQPCGIDQQSFFFDPVARQATRTALGLKDKFVLAYSGSLGRHQMFLQMLEIAQLFLEKSPAAFLLVLTTDLVTAQQMIKYSGLPPDRFLVKNVANRELPVYLMASDLGLLIRANDPINQVASPVKFSEYTACGLAVLATNNIGDIPEILLREKLGFLLNAPVTSWALKKIVATILKEQEMIQSNSEKMRISQFGQQYYGWEKLARQTLLVYRQL